MIVVSNASPIINLAAIDRLYIKILFLAVPFSTRMSLSTDNRGFFFIDTDLFLLYN